MPFVNAAHRSQVVGLWETVFGYEAAHNNPSLVIDKKIEVDDQLFFVAVADSAVVGTIMAGYDGHAVGFTLSQSLQHVAGKASALGLSPMRSAP